MSSKKLIVGNWKMNPATLDEAKTISKKTRSISQKLSNLEVVVCPPFVYVDSVIPKKPTKGFSIGSQDVSFEDNGAHTGEVGAGMLSNLGISHVLVGHSEKRKAGDTDSVVSKKLLKVVEHGMNAILCVGEEKRDDGGIHYDVVREQIKNSLLGIPNKYAKNIIIAYEPVWAIGAQEPMDPKEICEMAIFVRKVFSDIFNQDTAMKAKVLYGGAVNFRNAAEIINISQVDGLLVGRESVNMPGFKELLKAVDTI